MNKNHLSRLTLDCQILHTKKKLTSNKNYMHSDKDKFKKERKQKKNTTPLLLLLCFKRWMYKNLQSYIKICIEERNANQTLTE